jgi:hypothetical protein
MSSDPSGRKGHLKDSTLIGPCPTRHPSSIGAVDVVILPLAGEAEAAGFTNDTQNEKMLRDLKNGR